MEDFNKCFAISSSLLYKSMKVLVAGLINIETTVSIDNFPIAYAPIDYKFFGIESTISGVGYNIAKGLKTLGARPQVLSIIGNDMYKSLIKDELDKEGIDTSHILPILKHTPQSVVMYDKTGKRKIILDLKEIQETVYPYEKLEEILAAIDVVVPCNINFARALLKEAKKAGKLIATDVHVVSNTEDDYNKEFMSYADILFMSNENIVNQEESFIKEVAAKYHNKVIVVGMGSQGAMMYDRDKESIIHMPAVTTRTIVSTVGAGDALFTAFLYFYCKDRDSYLALKKAMVFASYKIGEKGAANGFIKEEDVLKIMDEYNIK